MVELFVFNGLVVEEVGGLDGLVWVLVGGIGCCGLEFLDL